jgi:hypothetical protein
MLQSIQMQAQQGAIPPADLARIMSLVIQDKKDLAGAVQAVQKEAQERQATAVPQGAPEAMPGLAMAGMGAEAPVEAPPAGPPNLDALLAQLGA